MPENLFRILSSTSKTLSSSAKSTNTTLETSNLWQNSHTLDSSQTSTGSQSPSLSYLLAKLSVTSVDFPSVSIANYHTDNIASISYQETSMLSQHIEYPDTPEYNHPSYVNTGISLAEQHRIKAHFYINQLTPPSDKHIITSLETSLHRDLSWEIAQLIKLKCKVFPGWFANDLQCKYIEQHLARLNCIECCELCQLPRGSYCNNTFSTNQLRFHGISKKYIAPHRRPLPPIPSNCPNMQSTSSSGSHHTTTKRNQSRQRRNHIWRNTNRNLSHSQETTLRESITEALDHPIQSHLNHILLELCLGNQVSTDN